MAKGKGKPKGKMPMFGKKGAMPMKKGAKAMPPKARMAKMEKSDIPV